MTEKDKKCTAYHEVGHAILAHVLPGCDPVHEVSIIPRGMAAGYTMTLPETDDQHQFKSEMLDEITMMLGGRAAEKLVLDDISAGASNDIERSTGMARAMVVKYGMSDELGPVFYGESNDEIFIGRELGHVKNYSEEKAAVIDGAVQKIMSDAYQKALTLLKENMEKLHYIAKELFTREKLDGDEFARLMRGESLSESPATASLEESALEDEQN